jgi:hypothetical protein
MLGLIEWCIWAVLALVTLSFWLGIIGSLARQRPFTYAVVIQATAFSVLLIVLYLNPQWNKLHIVWIAPAVFFLAPRLVVAYVWGRLNRPQGNHQRETTDTRARKPETPNDDSDVGGAHFHFMTELPHPKMNTPAGMFRSGEAVFMYYENPRTIGAVTAGIESPYKYPQVVVVSDQKRPLVIVRIEENAFGGSMLCTIDANGKHTNLGPFTRTSRDAFITKVGDIVSRMSRS